MGQMKNMAGLSVILRFTRVLHSRQNDNPRLTQETDQSELLIEVVVVFPLSGHLLTSKLVMTSKLENQLDFNPFGCVFSGTTFLYNECFLCLGEKSIKLSEIIET